MWAQTSGVEILCTTEGYCSIPNNGYIPLGSCPFTADESHDINPLIESPSELLSSGWATGSEPTATYNHFRSFGANFWLRVRASGVGANLRAESRKAPPLPARLRIGRAGNCYYEFSPL
jgi:hypothetical protein